MKYLSDNGDTTDEVGHGTSVASIIAGKAPGNYPLGKQYDGIASDAKLFVMDMQPVASILNIPADLKTGHLLWVTLSAKLFIRVLIFSQI